MVLQAMIGAIKEDKRPVIRVFLDHEVDINLRVRLLLTVHSTFTYPCGLSADIPSSIG